MGQNGWEEESVVWKHEGKGIQLWINRLLGTLYVCSLLAAEPKHVLPLGGAIGETSFWPLRQEKGGIP